MVRHWLVKTEPEAFSIDDLKRLGRTSWDGVRNYQARNFMRDEMALGDWVPDGAPETECGFVVRSLEPDRVLMMPDGSLDHWRDEYLDLVELR